MFQTVLGTDIAVKLRKRGFNGLIVVRSANSSVVDNAMYMSTGAVDGCLGKELGFKAMAKDITELHDESRQKRRRVAGVVDTRI
jgi:hypothetical protein